MRSRRSCLSVPGSSEKMLAKARSLPADEIVIDLEDSVGEGAKERARRDVAAALGEHDWGGRTVAVRVNGTRTRHCFRDLIEIVAHGGDALACVVVPKVESAADVEFADRLLGMVEEEAGRGRPVGVEALIETAGGLRRVHEIACASPRLEALIIGYADLSASLGRPPGAEYPGDRWHWARETVLVAAREAGLQAIDGPHLEIADLDGLRASALGARALGYDGKWALHPTQVEPLNELFAPTQEEFDKASAVLEALADGAAGDRPGAVLLEGEMIDEASRKLAVQLVARGTAAGLARGPSSTPT